MFVNWQLERLLNDEIQLMGQGQFMLIQHAAEFISRTLLLFFGSSKISSWMVDQEDPRLSSCRKQCSPRESFLSAFGSRLLFKDNSLIALSSSKHLSHTHCPPTYSHG